MTLSDDAFMDEIAAEFAPRPMAERGRQPARQRPAAKFASPVGQPPQVSEDMIALSFTEAHRHDMRYDNDAGRWYQWTGSRWSPDRKSVAFHYAREIGRLLGDGKRSMCKASVAGGAERFARADPAHSVTADVWDADPMMLGTPGGTVNLRTGKMRTASPGDHITRSTACAPESGEPRLWLQFLEQTTGGDAALIRFLQQWFGYSLTGDTREHALLFGFGPGGNGKGVLINTAAKILGDYAVTASMDVFISSRGDKHPTDLAMLRGARLVTASETEEGRNWAEARIKQLTGGDPITARFMRQDFFTFQPQFKLLIVGNHQPVLHSVDDAMRRRFNIVPFTHRPPAPDRQLEAKLAAEHGRILNWMIEGCADWQAHGLVRPASVSAATSDYFQEQDVFGQWLADRCSTGAGKYEPAGKLFEDWRAYAKANGEEAGSAKAFGGTMRKRGFRPDQLPTSGRTRVYRGIELKQAHRYDEDQGFPAR